MRPAKEEDKDPVLKFTERTWEEGDYIKHVWDKWINDKNGILLVGDLNGEPIALLHCRYLPDNSGWLEGLRVHPDYRRKGVATQINREALKFLKKRGINVIRGAIFEGNTASINLTKKLGFTLINPDWLIYHIEPKKLEDDEINFYKAIQPVEISIKELVDSSEYNLRNGLFYYWWSWFKLTEESYQNAIGKYGKLKAIKDQGGVLIYSEMLEERKIIEVNYISSNKINLKNALITIKNSVEDEIKFIRVPIPENSPLVEKINSLGGVVEEKVHIFQGHI